jgi:Asp/Glu/hydantoin racemase
MNSKEVFSTVRVKYVNPVGTGELDSYFQDRLAGAAGGDVEIEVCHLELDAAPEGPFLPRLPFYQGVLFETLKRVEDDGYDAAVIGCSGDPGLFEARRMLRMPVTAPLEAALHLAATLHPRVAILVADGWDAHVLYHDLARGYGLDHLISEILTVPMEYPDPDRLRELMATDPADACRLVIERHRAVLEGPALELAQRALRRGAGVVYAGCTLWTGEMLVPFRAALGAPVLDPGQASVTMAAAAARARAGVPAASSANLPLALA